MVRNRCLARADSEGVAWRLANGFREGRKKGTFFFSVEPASQIRSVRAMPRTAWASVGELCTCVLNLGNARAESFRKPDDYCITTRGPEGISWPPESDSRCSRQVHLYTTDRRSPR